MVLGPRRTPPQHSSKQSPRTLSSHNALKKRDGQRDLKKLITLTLYMWLLKTSAQTILTFTCFLDCCMEKKKVPFSGPFRVSTYQLYSVHSPPGHLLRSSPVSSPPLGRCVGFYSLTRTGSTDEACSFYLQTQFIQLHTVVYSWLYKYSNCENAANWEFLVF